MQLNIIRSNFFFYIFSVKAGVEFSIADISGDDLMGQREALNGQGVQVQVLLPKTPRPKFINVRWLT